jgi:S-DNA-T family DNA segregation ATPase FtsK/SpoIIIE
LAQAHRIKTASPTGIGVGILRFLHGALLETGFWLLVALALGMIVALATFNPMDPAWTHTAEVARIHNLGGVAGAWFADVALYFFGYPAGLLPLGVIFGGWRLLKRGTLLDLDAEIVLFRLLGFAVTLATASGLAALHLHVVPGTVPGDGTAGGLVGVYVGRFLTQAFGFVNGNAFMAALFLGGVTLTTGVSWLTILDVIGGGTLKLLDWIGSLALLPLRWIWPGDKVKDQDIQDAGAGNAGGEPAAATVASGGVAMADQTRQVLGRWLRAATGTPLNWWRARRMAAKSAAVSAAPAGTPPAAPVPEPLSVAGTGDGTAVPTGRYSTRLERVEPVLNLPLAGEGQAPVTAVHGPAGGAGPEPLGPDMLTLIPTAATASAPAANLSAVAPVPPPVRAPWWFDDGVTLAASNDAGEPMAPPPAMPATQPSSALLDEASRDPGGPILFPPPGASAAGPIRTPVAAMVRRVAVPAPIAPYPLPSLDLLDRPPPRTAGYSSQTLDEMSRQVEAQLKSFGIEVKVVAVVPGPVITRFEIEPAPGIKVSQISNLAKDLARGLLVISVRVVEVIPGKSVIGLEIPNRKREIVYLREVLEAPVYTESAASLTLALGKDIGGRPVVANLARMPHLLVAGTTGSGKSVAINAMLLSLLYKAPPSEVRLILVDPKMLELSVYEDIPHLLTPVVTDMKEAANALRWCVAEMERRYRLMATLKVRNIAGFNHKVLDALAAGEGLPDPFWRPDGTESPGEIPVLGPLPFIVVVIDELADMMMIVGKKVEELIARLAQKARAAGIHLILATQRPSVDVITGLIKANIPTRIAFQVSSRVDSRTILDQMGAEQLLGHGDMLYLPPGTGLPQRVHGAFVDDHEVNRVVDYLRQTGSPDYIDDVLAEPREESDNGNGNGDGDGRNGESDPLYDEAVRIVTESRRASVSGVQRRLRIGYNRAARLVEEMETAGVVGPVQSNGSREVLAPPP